MSTLRVSAGARIILFLATLTTSAALMAAAGDAQVLPKPPGAPIKLPPWNASPAGPYPFTVQGVDNVPDLETTIMRTKVANGSTHLTRIHHRETPLEILFGTADAGVTWKTEALFQKRIGNPIANVAIPPSLNATAIYQAAVVKAAPHPDAARAWMTFLSSSRAQAVYRDYGFAAPPQT